MKISATLLLVLGVFFWSTNYVLGKVIVSTIPPLTLTYLRWCVALLIFLPFCWPEVKENWPKFKQNWRYFTLLGLTGSIGYNCFQYLAVKDTTAINATIINASTPMFTALGAYLVLSSKLFRTQVVGIAISFLGVLAVITKGQLLGLLNFTLNKGDLMMVIGVLVNTCYLLTLRKKGFVVPQRSLFIFALIGGLIAFLPAPFAEMYFTGTGWLGMVTGAHLASLIYLGIFPSILSMLFFNNAIVELGPVKASIFLNLSIVFSSILGIVLLGESLVLTHFIGGSLIFAGVWLTNKPQAEKAKISAEA